MNTPRTPAGASVEAEGQDGCRPLHWFAKHANATVAAVCIKMLLRAGADISARNADLYQPLHCAALNMTTIAACETLLAAGTPQPPRWSFPGSCAQVPT